MPGRYKALIVDGSGNGYLKTVCNYVHLNPVRAKLIGPGAALETFRWSSYGEYLKPAGKTSALAAGGPVAGRAPVVPMRSIPLGLARVPTLLRPRTGALRRGNPPSPSLTQYAGQFYAFKALSNSVALGLPQPVQASQPGSAE